jgi:hypothetical protein
MSEAMFGPQSDSFVLPVNSEVHIAFHDGRRLTVKVVEGENAGFSDTVDYQAIMVREGIVILSWQEHIGSTIVHVLDFAHDRSHTFVTPAKGGFLQLLGSLRASSVDVARNRELRAPRRLASRSLLSGADRKSGTRPDSDMTVCHGLAIDSRSR